jgi:hypothetical protein
MSEPTWYRYGLSADVSVIVHYTQSPTLTDLEALREMLAVQIAVLRRSEVAAGLTEGMLAAEETG